MAVWFGLEEKHQVKTLLLEILYLPCWWQVSIIVLIHHCSLTEALAFDTFQLLFVYPTFCPGSNLQSLHTELWDVEVGDETQKRQQIYLTLPNGRDSYTVTIVQ